MSWRGVSWRAIAAAACALAATGCDFVFRIDHIPEQRIDADVRPEDGAGVDADQLCASPVINTALDGTVPCAPWGMKYEDFGATVTSGSSGLVIKPQNQFNSVAGCYSSNSQPFGIGGVKAHVTDLVRGAAVYTTLQVHGPDLEIKASGTGVVVFQTTNNVQLGMAVISELPMWWRIRPVGTVDVIGEISPDGESWTMLGTASPGPPAPVGVELNAGVDNGFTGGQSVFDRLVVCP
ncbi:MAG TPA: hypothetical protein VFV99_15115 [Kofleriaceae bacterium]|nr:hypothetical protein [Kofleriaceae bacterium]